jgi:branched-chain amino acid transport system permease protein
MRSRDILVVGCGCGLVAALVLLPIVAMPLGFDYYVGFIRRIFIAAIAALGMSFLLGQCGLVAIGYAGFVGIGAYATVVAVDVGVTSGWLCCVFAVAAATIIGLAIGAVALRAKGVYFIMITLAFAQMLYYLAVSVPTYGGDDGYTLPVTPGFGLALDPEITLYNVTLLCLVLAFLVIVALGRSRFGAAMRGIRENETRMAVLGFPVFALKLAAFAGTAGLAGLSGALLAINNGFVSPSLMAVSQSLALMVMVVIGGVGALWSAPLGAAVWLIAQEALQSQTEYWRWPLGLALIAATFLLPRGLAAVSRTGRARS